MIQCINVLSALLSPTIAIVGIYLVWRQWQTSEKSRQNELFDRRYAFYVRLKEAYLRQHDESQPPLGAEDWLPFAEEAGFLFGKDIRDHVHKIADSPVEGSPFIPNDWFVKPFEKYLRL